LQSPLTLYFCFAVLRQYLWHHSAATTAAVQAHCSQLSSWRLLPPFDGTAGLSACCHARRVVASCSLAPARTDASDFSRAATVLQCTHAVSCDPTLLWSVLRQKLDQACTALLWDSFFHQVLAKVPLFDLSDAHQL
jgi:hypothetical protein